MEKNLKIKWIRHSHKLYANNKGPKGSYQHDSPIDESQNFKIKDLVNDLVKKDGFPDIIISSPFLRARQTSNILYENLKILKPDFTCDIWIDSKISEFLGFQKPYGEEADVSLETKKHYGSEKILLGERLESLNLRTKKHIDEILKDFKGNIWIISHGIVIKYISQNLNKYYNTNFSNNIDLESLDYISYYFP